MVSCLLLLLLFVGRCLSSGVVVVYCCWSLFVVRCLELSLLFVGCCSIVGVVVAVMCYCLLCVAVVVWCRQF